ncbi:hypothetical protein FGADI_8835 [Fusarium gaditjirri]|uniref:Uncharacterized protein n=1 Tax=Fusarium gaditjirri TaxID=282569 RepID=A0A8H4T1B1_9HYPO|nr:hypothetical protein FGADI_8835 [Fusarium gaditjirri]
MAGHRRSKRLESGSQPDQDKVTKVARVLKDEEEVVPGQNKRMEESAMEGPSGSGVDKTSPKDASPTDASPNRASEEALERELQGGCGPWLEGEEAEQDRKLEESSKRLQEGLDDFRMAIQWDLGLGYRQGNLYKLWPQLVGTISGFTEDAGFMNLSWDRLDEATQQRFIGYSPCAQQLFETPLVRAFMFERKSQDIEWTSPYWKAQAAIECFLREKNFHYDGEFQRFQYPNWRFTTINFYYSLEIRHNENQIGEFVGISRIEPRCVIKILKNGLGQYFPENPDPFLEKLISILAKQIAEFELILDSGRHIPQIVFHDPNTKIAWGFPFSAKAEGFNAQVVMKSVGGHDEALCNGMPVELVVSPMLVFYGEMKGWDYHKPSVQAPMRVCIGYIDGFNQDEVVETEGEDGEGEGEEEVKIIKDKEGKGDGDENKIEDEDEE